MNPVVYREEPCKGALNRCTGMPFRWTLNPYMGCVHRCAYCYVRAYEKRADRPSDDRYGRSIRIKTNVAQVLAWELHKRSWKRETVAIGAATDPYQPAEGQYRLTRGCLEALASVHNPFGLITRGPMIVRDVDVLQEASRRAEVSINVSIPTLDVDVWRLTEPGTSPPRQRLRAVRTLVDAGITVNVAMAPLLPGISDSTQQLETVIKGAREAGAANIWANVLHLRPGTREHFFEVLAKYWPQHVSRYRRLYARDSYLPAEETAPIHRRVAEVKASISVARPVSSRIVPPPAPEQLSLLALALGESATALDWHGLPVRRAAG
jgi:DNA repair photolyase